MTSSRVEGDGSITELPALVRDLGAQRVLLVCGRRSFEASGASRVLPALEEVAKVTRWSDFRPNSDVEDLSVGLDVLAASRSDLVVAVGGGTAMDLAKLLVAYSELDPDDLAATIGRGEPITSRRLGLVLVPTTSGSGSEATHFAVVYVGADKFSIAGPGLYADAVVLDPQLSLSGSPYQRATSGIDAIAQAIESLWASAADDRSRGSARQALDLLLPAIVPYVRTPVPDPALARAMTLGAHHAGRAIDISRTTAPHALSYGLTKHHGLPHGHAVGLTLGACIAVHAAASPEDLVEHVDPDRHAATMVTILELLGAEDAEAAHRRFDDLMDQVGLTPGLTQHGVVTADQRVALARGVNVERLGNNPVAFDTAGLEDLLARCG
ncbi:MAG: iron-containing alcohol dehydrogenase [Nitriliruptor sp.]|nr:MAG: iron-containing alcohol dehydrogenase [Nitriliruptor sp.]